MNNKIKLALCLMTLSAFLSFAQENDCRNLHINVGSEFQQGESLNIGPPGLPGKHGPVGRTGDAGAKGDKGDVGSLPLEAERKIVESNRVLVNISQKLTEGFQAVNEKMSEMQRSLEELKNNSTVGERGSNSNGRTKRHSHRTCGEMYESNPGAVSGMYILNPSGNNYVEVYCKVIENAAITTIRHNIADEVNVKGYEAKFSYQKLVEYERPPSYIREIIDAHSYCRQFIKYRCKGSILLKSDDQYGYWASQDNTRRDYWGGSSQSHHCACGITDTCIDKAHKCNCDQNANDITTSDEGYLSEKSHLPVGYLRFGDNGNDGENAWYQLGPLECF